MERAWKNALGLVIVYFAPLIAFWQRLIDEQPGMAVLLALAWLAIVGAGWMFWRVAAGTVTRIVDDLRARFDRKVEQRLSRYGKVYNEWLMASRRYLDAKGLATVGTFSPELDEVFVEVGLTARSPNQVPPDLLGASDADGSRRRTLGDPAATDRSRRRTLDDPAAADSSLRRSIWDFLDHDEPVVLAVLGAPGSGKTTLLNYVARRTARNAPERRRAYAVVLQLRDHARTVSAEPSLTLPALITTAMPSLPVAPPSGWWEHQLDRGRCVVLLDGLDEVAGTRERRDIVGWVNHQISVFPRNDFVVTSRPHGYRDAFVESAATLQVLSFTTEQVRDFLHGWYLAVERRATGESGRDVEMMAREAADDLLDRLAGSPSLYDLTINPLLLTMIANVHRFRRSLPSSRADLYGEVCQVMLWRRQEAKRMDLTLPGASKERLLGDLAYEMMRTGTRDMDRRHLLDLIRPRLKRVSDRVTPEDFVSDVGSNGLLVERERNQYAFAHLTFQEYLAARHIRDHGLERVLIDAVDDPWWRETTLLHLSGADADAIVEAALKSGTPAALSLAFDCDEIGAELAPELRRRLDEVMQAAFAPTSRPETRRLVAGVLASRYLRRLVPAASGTRICPDPVTADLYWLFQMDTGTPDPDTRPAERADTPIRGLWSTDATAFVSWINTVTATVGSGTRQGAGILYRLPGPADLDAMLKDSGPAAQVLRSRARRVWSSTGPSRALAVWTCEGGTPMNVVRGAELQAAVAADLRRSDIPDLLVAIAATEAAARLGRTGARILRASDEITQGMVAVRSGNDAHGLENSTALEELSAPLREADEASTVADRALRTLPGLDPASIASIRVALAEYPINRAVALLEHAASLGRDVAIAQEWSRDLGVDNVLPTVRAIRNRVDRVQQRLAHLSLSDASHRRHSPLVRLLSMDGHAPTFDLDAPPTPDVLGPSLYLAALAVLRPQPADDSRDPAARFAAALVHFSRSVTAEPIEIDLGRLADAVRRLPESAVQACRSPAWAGVILHRLRGAATVVLDRRQPLREDDATAIRVPALVLAAEAGYAGREELARDLRGLAAATCLMRRRRADREALETMILATG